MAFQRNLDIRCVRLQLYKFENQVLVDVEQIIPLPEAEDYQVKVREQSEEQQISDRKLKEYEKDYSQYIFQDKTYGKRRLVLAVVSQYLKDNQNTNFEQLRYEIFFDSLQGMNVVAELEEAQQLFVETGYKRHFIAENERLITSDNCQIAVSNQWGIGNINAFINRARELGYQIEAALP